MHKWKYLLGLAVILKSSSALAQSAPAPIGPQGVAVPIASGVKWTPQMWANAFQGKADLDTSAAIATSTGTALARAHGDRFREIGSVIDYGAKCDASTDDTAAFNRALAAAAPSASGAGGMTTHIVAIPGRECVISGVLRLPTGVWLKGYGMNGTVLDFGENSQIFFLNNAVSSVWAGAEVTDLYIKVSGADANQKFPIDMATNQPVSSSVRRVQIQGTFNGIDISGNNDTIDGVIMQAIKGIGIRVGQGSTAGNNTDPRIMNTTVSGDYSANQGHSSSAVLMLILDAGGLTLTNNDLVGGFIGTKIAPGVNQTVFHLFASNTVLSDSALGNGLLIDTTSPSAVVTNLNFDQAWASNAQQGDVLIRNNGNGSTGGIVDGVVLSYGRFYAANGDAIHINPNVANIEISHNAICGNSPNGSAVFVSTGVAGTRILFNRMPQVCDTFTYNSGTGVNAAGANDRLMIIGNDMSGLANLISANPVANDHLIIKDNLQSASSAASIGSAATVSLSAGYQNFSFSSANSTITKMQGVWAGRTVTLYNAANAPLSFGTGGNICATYTLLASNGALATYLPAGCWVIK